MTLDRYSISVVEESIHVLEVLLDSPEPLSLAELSKRTQLTKSKTFRILHTLEQHGLVQRTKEGCFRLGLRFLDFGQRVHDQMSLLDASHDVMDWLLAETNESVFLGVFEEGEALCVDARESSQSVRLFARIGRRAPLYAGGVPKVLLAFLPFDEQKRFLAETPLIPITPYTIQDRTQLERELERIRQNGYVIAINDLDEGAISVAAPIRDRTGQVVAGISVAGPLHRFDQACQQRCLSLVLEGAGRISRSLGYRGANGADVSRPSMTVTHSYQQ